MNNVCMPSSSLLCTICAPRIIEPEIGQSQQQEIKPALGDFKSQASLGLFLRHHELTNENVSYF